MDFQFHARLGQQAADIPIAAGRSHDDLPAGLSQIGHGLRQAGIEFHLIDDRQHLGLAGADFGEVPPQGLEVRDPAGTVLAPEVRAVGRQQLPDGQFEEIAAGHRAVEIGHEDPPTP